MDLSKTFDCILHDLLIAKLHAYGLDFGTVTFLHNYLNCLKQSVLKQLTVYLVFSELYFRVYQKVQY